MSQLGMTVMLYMLGMDYGVTAQVIKESLGKTITKLELDLDKDELHMWFDDGMAIKIFDDGQCCCENRYMHTDDTLGDFVGSKLQKLEVRDGPTDSESEWGDVKDSQFLIITTSLGQFTLVNYNEHNGYYGGFAVAARELNRPGDNQGH